MVDEDAARRAVEAALAEHPRPAREDDEVVVWKVEEHARAWVVHVATRRWLRTRHHLDLLVGASPYVVERTTGRLHRYGSAPAEHARFSAWLDPED